MNPVGVGFVLGLTVLGWNNDEPPRVGRLSDPAIVEASGMVASRRHPGIFWVHNDSGNLPELFAVRRDGSLVRTYRVAAANVDWEDIATDDAGHLFIGDIGNNKRLLPLRAIHEILEPDPSDPASAARPLQVTASYHFRYPTVGPFDAEGLVIIDRQALILTKRHDGKPADVYRLRIDKPAPLARPLVPERVACLPDCVQAVTGAAWNPTDRLLAVVTERSVRVYQPAQARDEWQLIGSIRFAVGDVEATAWSGLDLILASEDRSLYWVAEQRWRSGR